MDNKYVSILIKENENVKIDNLLSYFPLDVQKLVKEEKANTNTQESIHFVNDVYKEFISLKNELIKKRLSKNRTVPNLKTIESFELFVDECFESGNNFFPTYINRTLRRFINEDYISRNF